MDTIPHNQGYWFVVREDQGNVIFNSNNISTAQNTHVGTGQEPRYVVETNRQYVRVDEVVASATVAVAAGQDDTQSSDRGRKRGKARDEELWDRDNIKMLLTLCLDNRGVEKETLWKEIGNIIGVSPDQCSIKYRSLRRTYLRLLKKKRSGKDVKWVHYNICEEVFTDLKGLPPSVLEPWEDAKTRRLLTLYIENLHKFRSPGYLQKDIWREIATLLGTTGYSCYHKFKNLRRAYTNWLSRSQETGKVIKWPYQHYFERIYYNYKPLVRPWDRNKIKQLLEAYRQIAHKFKNPRFQKRELWKEIAAKVGESPTICDKKFRNLKQTYVRLRMKAETGRLTTKWRYYKEFDAIWASAARYIDIDGTQKIVYRTCQDEDYIKLLLTFYLENKQKFRDPLTKKKCLWKMISPKLGLTADECDKKFRNLKQTYIRLAWKKKQTGKCSKWPYYSYFEQIFDEPELQMMDGSRTDVDDVMLCEIRRAVEDVHERKENDRKFEALMQVVQDSNQIQRERNRILAALLQRK